MNLRWCKWQNASWAGALLGAKRRSIVGWWAPMLLKRGVGRHAWLHPRDEEGANLRGFRPTVLARPRRESYAGSGRPRYLLHKDGVRSQASWKCDMAKTPRRGNSAVCLVLKSERIVSPVLRHRRRFGRHCRQSRVWGSLWWKWERRRGWGERNQSAHRRSWSASEDARFQHLGCRHLMLAIRNPRKLAGGWQDYLNNGFMEQIGFTFGPQQRGR